jgi:inward rectifier potassium channel
VIKDEITAEGQPMRRGYPLELERPNMPVLSLAWNLIHVLDERSPISSLKQPSGNAGIMGFIASLTAHDDTMAETVHARQFYNLEDLHHNVRFVDMIDASSVPGVITIDHALLNEVRPISLSQLSSPPARPADESSGAESGGSSAEVGSAD